MTGKQINPFEAFRATGSSLANMASEQFAVQTENNAATPLFAALNKHHQSRALELARDLEVTKYEQVLSFGFPAQQALKKFTSQMLQHIQRKDVSKAGDILFDLMQLLEKIEPDALIVEEKGLFARIFSKPKQSIHEVITQYNKLSKRIDRLSIQLSHTQNGLLSDFNLLDELYALNEEYFHEINVYIAALEIKKDYMQQTVVPTIQQQLTTTDDPMQKHQLQDALVQLEWLDKRMYDLEISREIAIQCAPQLRMIQQTNQMLIEKIQSSVMSTIPLWQTQISMLLTIGKQRRASETQARLMRASDEMRRKNAKMLDVTTKNTHKKAVSHTDIDHFKQTQLQLLQEIEDTLRIQATSNEKRQVVEHQILKLN